MYSLSFSGGMHSLNPGQYLSTWNAKSSDSGSMISLLREYFFSFSEISGRTSAQFTRGLRFSEIRASSCSNMSLISETVLGPVRNASIIARRVRFASVEKIM